MRRVLVLLSLTVALAACDGDKTPKIDPIIPPTPGPPGQPPAVVPVAVRVPPLYVGTFYSSLETCASRADDSRLEIAATELTFHEGGGPVTAVKEQGPGDILITGAISGEGEGPNPFTYHFKLTDGGQTLTDVTYPDSPFRRVRCPSK